MLLTPWFGALAGIVFLAACVRHNQRVGFQKGRPASSLLEEGAIWIASIEYSLNQNAPQGSVTHRSSQLEVGDFEATKGLMSLMEATGHGVAPLAGMTAEGSRTKRTDPAYCEISTSESHSTSRTR